MKRELIAVYMPVGMALDFAEAVGEIWAGGEELHEKFASDGYQALLYFGFEAGSAGMHPPVAFLHGVASRFVRGISRSPDIEFTRKAPVIGGEELLGILRNAPFVLGIEHISVKWLRDFWGKLGRAFEVELESFGGSVADFVKHHNSSINVADRVFFHLVESKQDEYPFAFLATYAAAAKGGGVAHLPLKNALAEYKGQNRDAQILSLLSAVGKAAHQSDFISDLVESGEIFSPLKFLTDDAYVFLREIPIYEECGIMCRIPDWWRKKSTGFRVAVTVGGKPQPYVGMNELLSFDADIMLDDESLSREEIATLLAQTEGLAFLKGKWVEVDHSKLNEILNLYEHAEEIAQNGGLTFAEAIRLQLGLDSMVDEKAQMPLKSAMDSGLRAC